MKTKLRAGGIVAMAATVALFASACGSAEEPGAEPTAPAEETTEPAEPGEDREPVSLRWWHNGTGEPLLSFWDDVARQFEDANPHVTVEVSAFQNEELRNTILPTAIAGGDAPDVFQSWGGGELADYVTNNVVKDVTEWIPAPIVDAANVGFAVDGGIFGMPYTFLPSGFWVNMNLWEEAGLTEADFPGTLDELFERWDTLKEADITPVAVGGVAGWPAAHWWYWSALREVPADVMANSVATGDFSDPSWIAASELLQTILDQDAFNSGWQATDPQQGPSSASGQVVLGQAAMQLMGTWDFGVMGGIYNEQMGLDSAAQDHAEFISWFPFPQVPGAGGDPAAIMGGVDGFSVHADAPVEAAELLAFIVSPEVQAAYAAMGNIPVDTSAVEAMPEGPLFNAANALAAASSVQLWLDTAMGPVGASMNDVLVAFMMGQGSAQDVVDGLTRLAQG